MPQVRGSFDRISDSTRASLAYRIAPPRSVWMLNVQITISGNATSIPPRDGDDPAARRQRVVLRMAEITGKTRAAREQGQRDQHPAKILQAGASPGKPVEQAECRCEPDQPDHQQHRIAGDARLQLVGRSFSAAKQQVQQQCADHQCREREGREKPADESQRQRRIYPAQPGSSLLAAFRPRPAGPD